MVGRTLLMLSLLATLSLSGCLGDGAEEAPEELDAAPVDETPAPSPRRTAVESGEVTPVPETLTWDGHVATNVFACAVVTCTGQSFGDWDNTHAVAGAVGGEVTLSWDTPNELAFGLATRCDGICDFVTADSGASPVSLTLDGLDPDRSYLLVVWHPWSQVAVVGGQGGPQTSFQVEGTLMVVPDA